jgi:Fe2+ or Zn2+ uptake regulation protein
MEYKKVFSEHLRITILRMLAEQPDYTLNDSMIRDIVPSYGFRPSRDFIRTQLAWLAEQGLVRMDTTKDGCCVVRLAERGEEVARGYATVPGVKRPFPGGN